MNTKKLVDVTLDEESAAHFIAEAVARGGSWAVYQNQDFGHSRFGEAQMLKFGDGCTFPAPPKTLPDGAYGLGWRYMLVGVLDPATGEVAVSK